MLPEAEDLQEVVHVINVPIVAGGQVIKVLMNADMDKGMAILSAEQGDFNVTLKEHKAVNKDDLKELIKEVKINLNGILDFEKYGITEILLYEFVNRLTTSPVRYRLLFVLRDLNLLDVLKPFVKGYLEGVNVLISKASTYRITELVQIDYLSQKDFESIKEDVKLDYKEII